MDNCTCIYTFNCINIYVGDTGQQGSAGEPGAKGTKGSQGDIIHVRANIFNQRIILVI